MIDANLPGITVQPMELMGTGGEGGTDSGVKNTVFFDDVRVPAFALVGGLNKGWQVATTHLELEHGGGGRIGRNRVWDRLLRYCQETKCDGVPLSQQQDVRDGLADIYLKTEITRLFGLRNFWLTYARQPKSYEGPQLSYYRKMAGLWMTGAILDMFQTIGLDDNRQAFFEMFDSWANELKPARPEASEAAWESFKTSMYGGDFLFNVSREFVSRCQTPLLVLLGNDMEFSSLGALFTSP